MAEFEQPPSSEMMNVKNPFTGEVGSLPAAQAREAIANQVYLPATPEDLHQYVQNQKYGSTTEQALTGLEGAGSAATFGLSTAAERRLGVPKEDILGRREANPVSHGIGQGLGLVASNLIPGLGEAADVEAGANAAKLFSAQGLMTAAGENASKALGLGGETALSKIGSSAVQSAVETAMFQGGDEVSKMIAGDPNQSVQTAATNIGLSGLLGGGIGAGIGTISPLWKATSGGKLSQVLKAFSDKAGGIEGAAPNALEEALQTSGIQMAPEVRAGLSENPEIREMVKTLEQSDTTHSGQQFQQSMKDFRTNASDAIVRSLGKSPEEVPALTNFSEYEAGKKVGETLASEFSKSVDPLAEKFESIREKYKGLELPQDEVVKELAPNANPYLAAESVSNVRPGTTSQISEKIGELAQNQGWYSSPSSDIMREVSRVLKELPQQKTLSDLSNYITQIGNNTYDVMNPQLTRAGSLMKNILKEAEADLVVKKLSIDAPDLVAEHAAARQAWKEAADLKDALNDRLHIKGGGSPVSFIKNLKDMAKTDPEALLRRLSGKGDADLLQVLQTKFPETANLIRGYHVDQLLKTAGTKAGPNEAISAQVFRTAMNKMSPELKSFAIPESAQRSIDSVGTLLDHFNELPHNFSNTARTLDKLWSNLPGSAVGLATLMTGHNPAMAFILGGLTKWLGKDAPDAARLAMLKFLGSSQPIESEGFKSMVDYLQHTIKGENLIGKASKAIFKAGAEVLPTTMLPSEKERSKLDQQLAAIQKDPNVMLNIGGKTGHYLPDHGTALASTSMNAVNYLNSLRPSKDKASPLDPEPKISKMAEANYQNALAIAEQPLLVLGRIKQGTVTSQDIIHLNALYPQLREKLAQKMTNDMITAVSKKETIPYATKMGLSLFMATPLDSTMTPTAIQAAQMSMHMGEGQNQPMNPAPRRHSSAAMMKLGQGMATPQQAREASRGSFH